MDAATAPDSLAEIASAPTAAARRPFPDRLRAIALLGIVLVNAAFFAFPDATAAAAGPVDRLAAALVATFAQGKCYLLFAFLFGYSSCFVLKDGGPAGRAAFARRLLALGLLGALHVALAFVGDVLISYAVLGVVLLYLVRRPDRTAWKAAGLSFAVTAAWLYLVTLAAREFPGDGAPERNVADELGLALRYGSFAEAVAARSSAWPMVFFALVVLHWGPILACFAVGLVAGRREWFTDLDAHASRWRRWAFGGLLLGVPTQALVVGRVEWRAETAPDAEGERLAATALGVVLAPILSAGYVGLLALWSRRGSRFLAWIEPAGRMSLSVYVGQSVLLSLFYCGYGAGFYERLAPAAVFLTAAASWAILVVASRYWLRRFARGPLETIVAACTHGRASRA